MTRAIIYFVLGAVLLGLGVGGAFMVAGWAVMLDVHAPTSRKL